MSTLTVGTNQQYTTIEGAVAAAQGGDTINVQAGTYTNDFITVGKNLTLNAVGGIVTLDATQSPPNGKAILDEGGSGVSVSINGFAFTGAAVGDNNGAGIRYEGGALSVSNSDFYGNQEGILGAADPNGTITISNSEFNDNGAGDGYSHNIYIGDINQFTLTNSYVHDANVGNEVKSRAENNTITGNRIYDNMSSSSYDIDLPNGGNATISGNTIEKGPNSGNYNSIAYGEEGNLHSGTNLQVTGNIFVNDRGSGPALWNATGVAATFSNNSIEGFSGNTVVNGPANQSGTTVLGSRPTLSTAAPYTVPASSTTTPTTAPTPTPTPAPTPAPSGPGLVVSVAEDAWQGDAQFTVTVDGQQVGGTYTATASHAAGQSQATTVDGTLSAGAHTVGIAFINDAYGGTASTDRNLYVTGASYNGTAIGGAADTLFNNGADTFAVPAAVTTAAAGTPGGLVVNVAEDAWGGDAQFTVTVDGHQVGGTYTATASHGAGQSQAVAVDGSLAGGAHTIGVNFVNDAYGGTASTDRNLYVTGASYNGTAIGGAAETLFSNGTDTFGVTAPAVTSTAVLNVSEDAWQGDAQFTVSVDGKQYGGIYTATASHAAGQSQAVTISGIPENFSAHDVAVSFVNDAYGGTASTDRNLYVNSVTLDGQAVPNSAAALFTTSTQHFTAVAPSNYTG